MAAAILRFEDSRVTGPDSLRVSRLPAADKGGKWEICGICDGIEPDVFNILRDHYFNSGSRNTGKILQRALNIHGAGLVVDGIVGPRTRQELQDQLAATGEAVFLIALQEKRQAFYRSCKQFPTFGKGWLNRCDDAFSVAQALV